MERCLHALLVDARPNVPFEVVVVDNASDAPTREVLARWSDRALVHLSEENLGFGRACNLSVTMTDADRIVLLNPDAVVLPGAIDALMGALDEYPGAGIVGGRTLRPDGSVDPSSCWGGPTLWSWFCFAVGLSTAFPRSRLLDPESLGAWQRDSASEVEIVTGCLLAAERTTWEKLDGFDERFFMYGEDADLSMRARSLGWRPRITPDAVVIHAVGASSRNKAHKLAPPHDGQGDAGAPALVTRQCAGRRAPAARRRHGAWPGGDGHARTATVMAAAAHRSCVDARLVALGAIAAPSVRVPV